MDRESDISARSAGSGAAAGATGSSSSTTSGSITEPPLATARMARTRSSTLATRSLSR